MKRAPLSLKAQALALLARREHSRAELRTKLLAHARKRAAHAAAAAAAPASGWGSGWEVDPFGESTAGAPSGDSAQEPDPDALAAEVDEVLDWLQAQRYQSDERFIESRLNSRAPRLGLSRIRQELSHHGVELDSETMRTLRQSEVQRAREIWRKRFGQAPADLRERARQMRFLAARGFSGEVVRQVLGGSDEAPD
ncbi:regulatory protein RecX [Ideonella dechloratans]|uniref:regulatory protein RecX n=1 Tax=Ideonella dechloratans TaxID=36863 RepID=UPI0035B3CDF8